MKKIISILLAAAMVLAFAACGNNSGNNGGNDAAVTDPLEVLNKVWSSLPEDQKFLYQTPGREAGSSAIGFADDAQEVVGRVANYKEAYERGHEIGTHFLGHWCEPNDGAVNSW